MNGFKHTKGPWLFGRTCTEPRKNYILGFDLNDQVVNENGVNAKSDATLIAAAPEMLDALINDYKNECTDCGWQNKCRITFLMCDRHCNKKSIIERATGLTIDEAIKAWEAVR